MIIVSKTARFSYRPLAAIAVVLIAGCALFAGDPNTSKLSLDGSQEVPPVYTSAKGKGQITILPDHSVSGTISVSGMVATAAHIHQGVAGKNGAVVIPLTKTADNAFAVPADKKLTDAQYASYKASGLYVNVHSAAHAGGEIRAQIQPPPPPKK